MPVKKKKPTKTKKKTSNTTTTFVGEGNQFKNYKQLKKIKKNQ